ncbi:MAG TPA: helix-turn-helix domain-containing protein [Syntrophobacteraceae bacterium]|nr:helix-turn-helix domain-containing protein [Syntrophobacteraceae bacterium]
MNSSNDISRLIREIRESTGLSQEKFAAKLGVTLPTVSRWEHGRAKPSPLALKQIENMLHTLGDKGQDLAREYFEREKGGEGRASGG